MSRGKGEIDAWLDAFRRAPAFLEKYPFYAAILGRMDPVADPSVKRMAVSLHGGRFYLHVNIDSFVAEPQYLLGVLLHEVHHVVLGHLCHPRFAEVEEPEIMDLAIEMSANEYIEEPLPDPITWQPYSSMGLRAGQSTVERYDRLVQAMRQGASGPGGTSAKAAPGQGKSAGGADRLDDHRHLRRGEGEPGGVEQTRQLIASAIADTGLGQEEVQSLLVAGKTPGQLLEELTSVLGPAETFLDWKTALRMFVARTRAPVHTYSRPNRRFPGRVGEIPGRTYSPRVIARPRLLVALDTSMSMTGAELSEVARHLARLAEQAEITVAECDVEITRVFAWAGALTEVRGRGGTDLRPVFEEAFLAPRGVHGVVYFTDGEGPTPEKGPAVPVLWILTKPREFRCPWGERAWLGRKAPPPKVTPKAKKRSS